MPEQRIKALLISIGGSPEPVIYSINDLRPECLCLFASEETRLIINNDSAGIDLFLLTDLSRLSGNAMRRCLSLFAG